jgi:hypothetical protein
MLTASPIEEVEMNTTTSPGTLRIVAGSCAWKPQSGASSWQPQAGSSCWEPKAGASSWELVAGASAWNTPVAGAVAWR